VRIESPFGVSRLRDKNININHRTEEQRKVEGEIRQREKEREETKERDRQSGSGVYSIHFVHPLAAPFNGTDEFRSLPWQLVSRKLTGDSFSGEEMQDAKAWDCTHMSVDLIEGRGTKKFFSDFAT